MIFETKFEIGQAVYFMADDNITKGIISHITVDIFNNDGINPANEIYTVDFINERNGCIKLGFTGTELCTSVDELVERLLDKFKE